MIAVAAVAAVVAAVAAAVLDHKGVHLELEVEVVLEPVSPLVPRTMLLRSVHSHVAVSSVVLCHRSAEGS